MSLPVNPTMVDQRNMVMINQLGQHPPLPPVSCGPRTQQMLPSVLSRFVITTQQNAERSRLRTFYFNLISNNYWNNEFCAFALKTTLDIVELSLASMTGDPNQIVEAAVNESAALLVAYFANHYSNAGLAQFIDGPTWNSINAALVKLQQLQQTAQQMQQGFQNTMPQYGLPVTQMNTVPMQAHGAPYNTNQLPVGMSGMVPAGFQAPQTGLGGMTRRGEMTAVPEPAQPTVLAPMVHPVNEFRRGIQRGLMESTPEPVVQPVAKESIVSEVRGGPASPVEVTMVRPAAPRAETVQQLGARDAPARRPVIKLKPSSEVDLARESASPVVARPESKTPERAPNKPTYTVTYPDDPYREIVMADGTVCRRAEDSGWTPTFTENAPYPLAYDPDVQLLVYIKTPDGTIRQMVRKLTNQKEKDMESYMEHELNPQLRQRERERLAADRPKAAIDWSRVTRLQVEPGKPYALEAVTEPPKETAAEASDETVTIDEPLESVNFEDVRRIEQVMSCEDPLSTIALAVSSYRELTNIILTHPVEMYGMRLDSRLTKRNLTPLVFELSQTVSYFDVVTRLQTLRQENPDDTEVLDFVQERLIGEVNYYLKVSLGIPWTITELSTVADVEELVSEIAKDYGERAANLFSDSAAMVISTACATLDTEEEFDANSPVGVVTFIKQYSVTSIPNTYEELSVRFNGIGAVSKAVLPEMFAFLDGIFRRTEDYPIPFYARYLRTSDNHWLRVDEAALASDTYLVREFSW